MTKDKKRAAIQMKSEMQMLNVLRLYETDSATLASALAAKVGEVPQFFQDTPLIVDCQGLEERCDEIDFTALRDLVLEHKFGLVGIRNIPLSCQDKAQESGWLILSAGLSQKDDEDENEDEPPPQETPAKSKPSKMITRPVRSGQQIYAPESDLVVTAHTSSGSELLSAGSIHVYGKLRGRVLAGINGDESARIFCQSLEADLIAIAGNYQLMDDVDTRLKGKPAMIYLVDKKLIIEPIV